MSKGNREIKKHASKGGAKLLELYGRDYFRKIGKRGRKKQLNAKKEGHS